MTKSGLQAATPSRDWSDNITEFTALAQSKLARLVHDELEALLLEFSEELPLKC